MVNEASPGFVFVALESSIEEGLECGLGGLTHIMEEI